MFFGISVSSFLTGIANARKITLKYAFLINSHDSSIFKNIKYQKTECNWESQPY